jgi:hypothetical protein
MKKIIFLILILSICSCSKKNFLESKIPFKYNDLIYLNVSVNKLKDKNFVFDTGWPGIALDSTFCKNAEIKSIDSTQEIIGIGNSNRIASIITDTIFFSISSQYKAFSNFTLGLNLKNIVGKHIDGVAGIRTFAYKPYVIDFTSKNIIFTENKQGFEEIKSQFRDNKIYLHLTISLKNNKQLSGYFLLDTGSARTILTSHLQLENGIFNESVKKKFVGRGGVGGYSNGFIIPIKQVNFGKFEIQNLISFISTDTTGSLSSTDYIGIVGNDLLDDFHIMIDHQKEKIWVKPNKNFNKNKTELFRGVSFIETGEKWLVNGIVLESDAYNQGVRMNDQVLEINNVKVEKIDFEKFVNKLKKNKKLKLKIKRDGKEWEIKFKLNVIVKY